jgi:excisionase family DNA binding protein
MPKIATDGVGRLEPLLSLADLERILGVSEPTVARLVRRGEIPVVAVGRRRLVEPAAVRRFIAARTRTRAS